MDPNIMKFLEEDEDETMHSGADVEAFTAELNRDIEGNTSMQEDPSDSNAAALSPGSSHMTSQFNPQWHTSSHDGTAKFQSGQDIANVREKDQLSSELELQRQDSGSQNRKEDDNTSHEPNPNQQDERNTFPLPQPVGGQLSGEQPINAQVLGHETKPDKELQMNKLQNVTHHPSMTVGSNEQQTSMGINNDQVMPPLSQQTTGMSTSNQQAISPGMSNPQTMTSSSQQSVSALKLNKQVPFGMLLPIIQPQLDKDRAMQLHTLYFKLKKNEISKDGFVRHMRSIVGDQMLKMAVYKLQTQAARNTQAAPNQFQPQPQASGRQMPSADLSNSVSDSNAAKPREMERQADSHGAQVGQMSTSTSGLGHETKHPAFPAQGLNKQQHMQFSQTSFPPYGSAGSGYPPFQTTSAASSAPIRPQPHDSQMRQAPSHPNMAVNHLGPASRPMNVTNMSSFDRSHSLTDPKKIPAGSLSHMNSKPALQQNQVQWPPSTSKEQKSSITSSMTHVKQEPSDQLNEHQRLGSAASGNLNLKDESFDIQSSRTGLTAPATLMPSSSVSSPSPSLMETNIMSSSRIPSLTTSVGLGNNSKAPPKKPMAGQKKPMEAPGPSPPSSKKQKVSGSFVDQSIEHLNDVTAVSGVNLREEEEQLFSGSKEDSRVSEASRRVVQEEEEKLILQKIPLQKMMVEIMAKCGLKNMSSDVERCLSLCTEERMRGILSNVIRLSKQRVDVEKSRHKTVITSDVRQQIMAINSKAREDWEKKQAETEKSQKLSESESSTGADGDKDDGHGKSVKVNKEEDDKMRATAANVAVRAATGVGDITSRWQLMIEAKQKQGGSDTSSAPQTNKDAGRKPLATSTRNTRENQDSEKRDPSAVLTTPASIRKVARNQVVVPRVARSVSVKDVIAVLEREPQMAKSTLLYRLYNRVSADAPSA
ncbi:transcription initiation factor TFIID subunit 4b-like isoform X1 [Salvia splendens]|uniref:transcription initiation factor TFIID subunit 4b-like isoform X1 n=1 Tax=Salvia splendens TaxID=180675 RepID=UPI001C253CA0|nr:transcription initiation factor TFIID subunit 4b-like isoform X1 [Salvia splendens]